MDNQDGQTLSEINARLEKELALMNFELQRKNRELEVEAALEKVRVKATGMRISAELAETSAVLFHQLNDLKIDAIRTGVGIFDDDNDAMEIWLTTFSDSQEVVRILDYVNLHIHPVFENIIPARKEGLPYAITILRGNEVKQYYQTMSTYLWLPKQTVYNPAEYFYSFFFSEGAINVISSQPLSDEECNIMIRFARVFGLIYTRFLDLQKAEAQTKDALKQTSLDRVRGQIASMRTAEDLQKITPLLWTELTTLGVSFFRCGVFIIDEIAKIAHVYLSASDGHSLGELNLSLDANPLTANIVDHWRKKIVYQVRWNQQDFINWTESMMELGQIRDRDKFQDAVAAPESLDLNFVPFEQGMLYIGNIIPQAEEEIDLIKSLADSFSIAYARYEDFVQLEKAKQSIESTLSELKAAQSQLIQAEKMASLGELTAGIAHEIQNPLNFVNNFSEVNTELIEELQHQLTTGNKEEVTAILNNIKNNELKINHHGKRADSIVKSMLQHSRTSSGQKELTNINILADEYLRLSYHGMRATNKNFNAEMRTFFDKSLSAAGEEINIVLQDIGRVLLNLYNNAFYAVNEKQKIINLEGLKKPKDLSYKPTISITTKKIGDKIQLTVKDNGNGMPQKVLDKIFQPFFTTKPPGEGTGLGLSLSYDIIKAHGGEIKVETKEGEFTEFSILLPLHI